MIESRILFIYSTLFLIYSYSYSITDNLEKCQKTFKKNDLIYQGSFQSVMDNVKERLIDNKFNEFLKNYNYDTTDCIRLLFNIKIDNIISTNQFWYSDLNADNGILYRNYSSHFVSQKMKSYSWIIRLYYELNLKNDEFMVFKSKNRRTIFDYKSKWLMDSTAIFDYKSKWLMDSTGFDLEYIRTNGFFIKTRVGDKPLHYYKIQSQEISELECKFQKWMIKLEYYGLDYLKSNKIAPLSEEEFEIQ
ncbi:MAG: hypothetical protein WC121_00590 [Candidatus Kapaibacterium sp.]|jgi:hypothetical protein